MDVRVVRAQGGTPYRLAWGRISVPVQRIWRTGLALAPRDARHMPGRVRLLREGRLVATGLVVSQELTAEEHLFHFKRLTLCAAGPARDWAPGAGLAADHPPISPGPLALRRLWG